MYTTSVHRSAVVIPQAQMAFQPQLAPPGVGPMVNYQQPVIIQLQPHQGTSRYSAKNGRATGCVQLVCAIASIILAITQIVLGSSVGIVGTGIWAGLLFFLPAGILGIVSHNKNKCVIIGYMVMSILATLTAFCVVCVGITAVAVSASDPCGFTYNQCGTESQNARIAIDSLLLITGFVEFVTSIVGASLCCAGIDCCCRSPSQHASGTVITHYSNQGAPMVVTTGTPLGQQLATPYGQPTGYAPPNPQGQMTQPAYPQSSYVQDAPPDYHAVAGGYDVESKQ